jgi:hypothetical protein
LFLFRRSPAILERAGRSVMMKQVPFNQQSANQVKLAQIFPQARLFRRGVWDQVFDGMP